MTNKLPTISLQGKQYCQVKDRVKAFNDIYSLGCIQTESRFIGDTVIFKATIYPDIQTQPSRFFTASSFGTIKATKAFEKLESTAVGRALAYLGFGIDGSIASFEEMEEFFAKQNLIEETKVETKQPNQSAKAYADDTRPWLTDEQFEAMLQTIEQGQGDLVRQKMENYKMKKQYREDLNKALNS